MTSLLRDDVSSPMCAAASTTTTERPSRASARAAASPMTPAPTTSASTSLMRNPLRVEFLDRSEARMGLDAAAAQQIEIVSPEPLPRSGVGGDVERKQPMQIAQTEIGRHFLG